MQIDFVPAAGQSVKGERCEEGHNVKSKSVSLSWKYTHTHTHTHTQTRTHTRSMACGRLVVLQSVLVVIPTELGLQ